MRRLGLFLCVLAIGCAMGGATDEDDGTKRDAIGLPEDGIDDDAGGDDADVIGDPGEDPDTTPLFDADEETAPPDPDAPPPADTKEPPPSDAGCTPTCVACGADDGCGNPCMTGSCATGTCVAGKCVAPVTPTKSYLSPGSYAFGSAWARGITWTIGSEAPSTIRYTLDGSAPGPGSPSKASPAELFVATSGTVIKWYADNGAKESTVHSFTANIATSGQDAYGYIVEKTNLGGKGPVIVASPGATISGSASYLAWNNPGCPMCRFQLIYGVGTAGAGCLYDWSPGAYPGASGTGTISVKAPSAAGVYDLNVSYTLQTSCANGIATNPIGARPTARIGTIVVR